MAGAGRDVEVWVGPDHVISAELPPGEAPLEVDGRTVVGEGVDWVWRPLLHFRDRDPRVGPRRPPLPSPHRPHGAFWRAWRA